MTSTSSSIKQFNQKLGQRIKFFRKQAGLSLKEVGNALNVSLQQIQKYETGLNRLSVDMLVRISAVLSVPIDALLEDSNVSNVLLDKSILCPICRLIKTITISHQS
jgi:transcriptional regulator with XRE-family HTH domain